MHSLVHQLLMKIIAVSILQEIFIDLRADHFGFTEYFHFM